MIVRPLIITTHAREEIAKCEAYARQHELSIHDIMAHVKGTLPIIGNDPHRVVTIPMGYRCVLSYEHQPVGFCRHISISVWPAEAGLGPSPEAVEGILEAFGFGKQPIKNMNLIGLDTDERTNDGRIVVNCIQLVKDT